MDKKIALKAIQDSLALGSNTPCTWRDDRDAYIDEKSTELLSNVIEPSKVTIIGEANNYGTLEELKADDVFAIARNDSRWLLHAPTLGVFALAYGEDPNKLNLLGFSSTDALGEWLG